MSASFFLTGCQKAPSEVSLKSGDQAGLRALTTDERSEDYDQLLMLFKSFYGPYQFKEARFNFKISDLAKTLKAASLSAPTDEAFAGTVMQLGAALQDGHVQIGLENTSSGISRYRVPVVLTPIEGKVIIGDIDKTLSTQSPLKVGDEVLLVDGKEPMSYLPTILKYSSIATPLSDKHLIFYLLARPSYMTDLVPTSSIVTLKVKHASGDSSTVNLAWEASRYNSELNKLPPIADSIRQLKVPMADDLNSVIEPAAAASGGRTTIKQMGDVNPFFLTPATQGSYHFIKVYPSDDTRKAVGLADKETPPIYAALYKYQDKTILLVREAAYEQDDFKSDVYLKGYQAIFAEFQDLADVLVLDQTHNPGGSYCADFYNLFANDGDVQSVEKVRADRKWVDDLKVNLVTADPKEAGTLDAEVTEAWGLLVEKAYDAGDFLSGPIPLFSGSNYTVKQAVTWKKPMLVLIDELAGSCGDMFPMLVKANKRAPLFGQTTMGLGGNVEEVGVLSNSRIHVKMTRGLYYPYAENGTSAYVENVGVAPDISYAHTVSDFRAGYTGYVKAFSDAALLQIPAPKSAASK